MHITQFAVDHNNTKVALIICERIFIGDDIDVPQFLQYLKLVLDVLPLLLIDLDRLYLFESVAVAFLGPMPAQKDVA